MHFLGARGPSGEKIRPPRKFLPKVALLFCVVHFARREPPGAGNCEILGLWPFWPRTALGTSRNSGRKTEKRNFPVLEALLREKYGRSKKFSPKFRNFFTVCALADRTPTGGQSRNTGFVGHFGLRHPWALGKIPGGKQKNTIFRY